jgi:hypothetical protein
MTMIQMEKRRTQMEQEMAELKARVMIPATSPNHWVEKIAGTFSSPDARAAFDEAMRYGRAWRKAQRPAARQSKVSK